MLCELLLNPNNLHFMLDIETLGTESDSVVTEIGLCSFSGNKEYAPSGVFGKLNIKEQVDAGRRIDKKTIEWHLENNTSNFLSYIDSDKGTCSDVLSEILTFVKSEKAKMPDSNIYIWANSPTFDIIILQSLYKSLGFDKSNSIFNKDLFSYSRIYDYRTVINLFGNSVKNLTIDNVTKEMESLSIESNKHNALYDAIYQSRVIANIANLSGE